MFHVINKCLNNVFYRQFLNGTKSLKNKLILSDADDYEINSFIAPVSPSSP